MRVLGTLLEGSGKYFAVCILLGLLLTVVEMIAPQVIRVTVDSVIDSQPMDLPAWALRWVESKAIPSVHRRNPRYRPQRTLRLCRRNLFFQEAF